MASMNRVFLAGNLVKDPELQQTGAGLAVSDLRLAVSESYTNKDGQQVETTMFTDVVVWGRQAEACQEHLRKGAPVLIEGRLETDSWETEQGQKRSRLRVRADPRTVSWPCPNSGNGNSNPAPGGAAPRHNPGRGVPAGAASDRR